MIQRVETQLIGIENQLEPLCFLYGGEKTSAGERPRTRRGVERAREAEAAAKALQWERSVQGFEALLRMAGASDPETQEAVDPVRGGEAVLTVMRDNKRVWTAREVHEELERRGWINLDVRHP